MADVASALRSWSATASSNSPSGSTVVGAGLDDNLRQIQATVRQYLASAATPMASAATVDLSTADGYYVTISGTTTITSFGTESAGISYLLRFSGALTLTHNGTSLILPGAANITTAAGDMALMISEGSGNWRVLWYTKANGAPLLPFIDSQPIVVGSSDATKKVAFEVDGLTTGTTRTVTIPDKSGTMAMTSDIASGITLGTKQATTSGTAIDFTSIPAGTKQITVMFVGVSTNASSNFLIQIGDSGGIKTSGYDSSANATGAASDATSTAGFILTQNLSPSDALQGSVRLNLVDASTFTWVSSGTLKQGAGSGASAFSAGSKSLSAELDRVRITTVSGDTFDAGAINIQYS